MRILVNLGRMFFVFLMIVGVIRMDSITKDYSDNAIGVMRMQKISAINPQSQGVVNNWIVDDDKDLQSIEVTGEFFVRVMSFNINHGADKNNQIDLDRLASEIKDSDADIIGLQEVDKYFIRSRFVNQIKYLSEALDMYYVYGENINILGNRYGNAILSRYPIIEFENIPLPGRGERRGLIKSKILIHNEIFNVFVTHLGLSSSARYKQIKAINTHMDYFENNTILIGDFNYLIDSKEFQLVNPRLIDVALLFNMDNKFTYAHNSYEYNVRIDRLYVTSDINVIDYDVLDTDASDHRSIYMDMVLKKGD